MHQSFLLILSFKAGKSWNVSLCLSVPLFLSPLLPTPCNHRELTGLGICSAFQRIALIILSDAQLSHFWPMGVSS